VTVLLYRGSAIQGLGQQCVVRPHRTAAHTAAPPRPLLTPSGHGDSNHRDGYDFWAAMLVAAAHGTDAPRAIGYNMGGLRAAKSLDRRLGMAIVDSSVRQPTPTNEAVEPALGLARCGRTRRSKTQSGATPLGLLPRTTAACRSADPQVPVRRGTDRVDVEESIRTFLLCPGVISAEPAASRSCVVSTGPSIPKRVGPPYVTPTLPPVALLHVLLAS
jgi:hypothetical protein